jgi:tRNA-(ms[2]io[6]A)-hydroxylase
LDEVLQFLACETPQAWLAAASSNQSCLLIDHANCEKKAAATAMNLMYRYTSRAELMIKMSQLAREELLHFQQVVEILASREIEYIRLSPSRYASSLRSYISTQGSARLVDTLIVGAFIEARSCERFASLAPQLDAELQRFYRGLLKSEARHFKDYLDLAQRYSDEDIADRVASFAEREAELIEAPDKLFRFHSGIPA